MRMRPALRYSWKPASARPVFWMCGLVMMRSRPAPPARSSSGRPNASGRLPRNAPTVMPSCAIADRARAWLRFGLHERQLAVAAAVEHADRRRLEVSKDDDAVAISRERPCGVGDRHRPNHLARRLENGGHPRTLAAQRDTAFG